MSPPAPDLRRRLRLMTGLSVALALIIAGLVGHLLAVTAPLDLGPAPAAPDAGPRITPSDPVGARHPSFDCGRFTGALGPYTGDAGAPIAALASTPAGQRVRTRGKVMAAYPRIMGRNWLQLCDAPGGDVLIVATADWAHPGDEVVAEGPLARDADIGGVYVFPLLIDGARLIGPAVIEAGVDPRGAIDL